MISGGGGAIRLECASNSRILNNEMHNLSINPIVLENSQHISISKNHISGEPQMDGFGLISLSEGTDYVSITRNIMNPGMIYGAVTHAYIANNEIVALPSPNSPDGWNAIRLWDYDCESGPGKIIIFGNRIKSAELGMILYAIENDKIAESNFFVKGDREVQITSAENTRIAHPDRCYE
jgi:hypothetical protein